MNRKILMIIGMVLLVAGVAYASGVVFFGGNAYESSEDKLVLDIDLTEANYVSGTKTFADDSGEGNDGVSNNSATFTTDKYGKSTGAMSFDGLTDYVNLSNPSSLNLIDAITISAWIYSKDIPTVDSDGRIIVRKDNSYILYFFCEVGLSCNLDFYLYGPNYRLSYSTSNFNEDEWYHVTATYDKQNMILYINGIEVNSSAQTAVISSSSKNTLIGKRSLSTLWNFNGSISQVKIYNRTLSATEVGALYNSSKPKASAGSQHKGLVGHWVLDSEGYNSNTESITDKTPYGNHGTNNGATLTTDQMGQSNKAMSFDGGSDYVNTADADGFSPSVDNITVTAWVLVPTGASGSGDSNCGGNGRYFAGKGAVSNYEWGFENENNNKICFTTWPLTGATKHSEVGYDMTVNDGAWHFYAATFDYGDVLTLYVDGENVSQDTSFGTAMGNGNAPVTISQRGDGQYFNGSISDVRIYNRVLSADEINTLYSSYRPKATSGSLQKGLVLDMPLTSKYITGDTPGSELIRDKTPYSNDGQNNGATVGSDSTSFSGDYILIDEDASLEPKNFTVSLWFKTSDTSTAQFQELFNKEDGYHEGFRIIYRSDAAAKRILYQVSEGPSNPHSLYSISNITETDVWHHILVTFEEYDQMKIYFDGAFENNLSIDMAWDSASSGDAAMGVHIDENPTSNYYAYGSMASVKMYNRALSESEIKLLYDKGRW